MKSIVKQTMSKDDITWPQLSRWWPIILGSMAVTLSYATLIAQITITNVKLDNAITLLKTHQDEEIKVITNLNDINRRIVVLETEHRNLTK